MILKLYLITFPVFFLIDLVWLSTVAKSFYSKNIGFLMKSQVNWPAAALFYLLYILGIVLFVVKPALAQDSWVYAAIFGALFGLISYSTYDLTNLATIKDWPLLVTIVDLIWGTVLTASVSVVSYFIAMRAGL